MTPHATFTLSGESAISATIKLVQAIGFVFLFGLMGLAFAAHAETLTGMRGGNVAVVLDAVPEHIVTEEVTVSKDVAVAKDVVADIMVSATTVMEGSHGLLDSQSPLDVPDPQNPQFPQDSQTTQGDNGERDADASASTRIETQEGQNELQNQNEPGTKSGVQDGAQDGAQGEALKGSQTGAQKQAQQTGAEDAPPTEISEIGRLISVGKILYAILILIVTYFLNKFVGLVIDNLAERATNYRLFIKRLGPASRILIWSLSIYIIIAGVIAPPMQTVIAIGASIGIAVGFASQDILKNIFGGIMIILDSPFQVGDKIAVGDHYGEVTSIGLRSSRIVTPDDSVVSIPNAELMNHAVSNSNSGALNCQVVAEIYLPATVDIPAVKRLAKDAVYASSYLFLNKPVEVIVLNELKDRNYVVKLRVKAYVLDIRYEFLFKSDMTEMILEECNRRGYLEGEVMPIPSQL